MSPVTSRLAVPFAAILALASGCSDDNPVEPQSKAWTEVALPGDTSNLFPTALVMEANQGYLVALRPSGTSYVTVIYRLDASGGWVVDPAGDVPAGAWLIDAVLVDGAPVFVGVAVGSLSAGAVIVDRRGGGSVLTFPSGTQLTRVAAGGGEVRAIGAYLGGFAVWSTEPGVWTQEPLTFSTGNEKGFWDLTYAEGMFYACGFDDGGPPYALFLDHTAATGWRPTAGPPPAFNRELRALSSGAPGVLLVGGTDADYSSVPTRLHARLFHRATSGDWAEFVLPEPESLQRVNAILRASDNATYLGCGVEATGAVIRAGDAGITATGAVPGPVLALAEAGSGEIYAVGTRQSGESTTVFLLRRGSE